MLGSGRQEEGLLFSSPSFFFWFASKLFGILLPFGVISRIEYLPKLVAAETINPTSHVASEVLDLMPLITTTLINKNNNTNNNINKNGHNSNKCKN